VGISMSGLASAVANEGGVGVIAGSVIGIFEPDFATDVLGHHINALKREIRRARELTNGILGVNIMVALTNFADMVRTAIEEKIDIIISGAGLPLSLPQYLQKGSTTKLVPIVSSGRAAKILCKKWKETYDYLPDAIVVEGPMAGGHLGFKKEQIDDPAFAIEKLIPEVLKEVRVFEKQYNREIPVIAAGGIYTGADILNIMKLGASGVQMATRFVTTHECDAEDAFKQAYLDAKEEDLVIIQSPVGMPGRAIRNQFIDDVNRGIKKPYGCPYHCLKTCNYKDSPYCIALCLANARNGRLTHGYVFAGKNAYRSDRIISVKELVNTIVKEYDEAQRAEADGCDSICPIHKAREAGV